MARIRRRAYPAPASVKEARPDPKYGKRGNARGKDTRPTGQAQRGNLPNRPRKDR